LNARYYFKDDIFVLSTSLTAASARVQHSAWYLFNKFLFNQNGTPEITKRAFSITEIKNNIESYYQENVDRFNDLATFFIESPCLAVCSKLSLETKYTALRVKAVFVTLNFSIKSRS